MPQLLLPQYTHTKSWHLTPVLKQFHRLPVSHGITFKVLVLTFKALHHLAPLPLPTHMVPQIHICCSPLHWELSPGLLPGCGTPSPKRSMTPTPSSPYSPALKPISSPLHIPRHPPPHTHTFQRFQFFEKRSINLYILILSIICYYYY